LQVISVPDSRPFTVEFRCRLASPRGDIVEGVYAAEHEAALRRELEEKGLLVLSLQPQGGVAGLAIQPRGQRRVSRAEFLVFNQELATLLKSGMPLVQSLDLLRRRVASPRFRSVLDAVHAQVQAGSALSDAFAAQGDLFPRVYTASLLAGERSGSLDGMLRRYVEYTKVIDTVRRKTISALIYPAILVTLALALVSIIVLRVVPAFSDFYTSFGADLPVATRAIVTASAVIRQQFLLVVAAAIGAAALVLTWGGRAERRAGLDRLILRVPLVGQVARKFATSQMARTLATLLGGGLPLVNALDIAARSISNRHMAAQLDIVGARVREGSAFAAALEARGVFPDVAVRMAEVGESTGALQDMLNTVADFYDEEIATQMERFVTLVEPVLLVAMGMVIAGLLLALYMPLFQLSSVLAR
jgi:type IV pilus assembly protein PilC